MSWFLFTLICVGGWGLADLFYKMGSDENDPYSHLKQTVWVGLVMGVCSLALLPFSETVYLSSLGSAALRYTPASLSYILSMMVGYAGLRYLELSIVSPVQNASGALSMLAMIVWFSVNGRLDGLADEFSLLDILGTAAITAGMIALAVVEQRQTANEISDKDSKKYRRGAAALIFPLGYCLLDTLGTAADGVILDEESGLGLGEIDVLILYGLTFLAAGIVSWLILYKKSGKAYQPFSLSEKPKAFAAVAEEFGQVFYVYAMAARPMLAAPAVASYCIVSVLLSRVFLKEKMQKQQYYCIFAVILGIVLLGVSEGLGSAD